MSGTLTTIGTFNFVVQATDTGLQTSLQSYQIVVTPPVGQQTFTTTGATAWVAPSGVTSVSVVCVGGGGGGGGWYGSGGAGGGLAWRNNVTVVPGTSYTVTVGVAGTGRPTGQDGIPGSVAGGNGGTSGFLTTVAGGGQHGGAYNQPSVKPSGGTFTGDGGGIGGTCEGNYSNGTIATTSGGEVLVGTVVREVRGEVLQPTVMLLLVLPLGLVAVAVAVGGVNKQIKRPIMVRLLGVGSVSTAREPTVLLV